MKNTQIKKLVLGTAQFGNTRYGAGSKNKISKKKIFQILNLAWKSGIKTYDTAESYGCYDILGEYIIKKKINDKIKIITKLPSIQKRNLKTFLPKILHRTLDKLNIKKINCLLLHDENDLNKINDNKKIFFEILKKFNVKNFGVSVYSIKKAKFALKNFKKVSIQFPFNIANNNFKDLRKKNNIFYARSLFLQGLLTEEKIYLQNKKIKIKHDMYKKYLRKNKINALNIALNYVFMNKNINYYVLGVRSHEQLKNILNFKFKINKQENLQYCKKIKKLFYKLNDPRKW